MITHLLTTNINQIYAVFLSRYVDHQILILCRSHRQNSHSFSALYAHCAAAQCRVMRAPVVLVAVPISFLNIHEQSLIIPNANVCLLISSYIDLKFKYLSNYPSNYFFKDLLNILQLRLLDIIKSYISWNSSKYNPIYISWYYAIV